MMRNIENQDVWIAKEKIKSYIRHSQKNLRHYIYCVVSKGVFRTQLNIHDGAFLRKQLTAFGRLLFLQKRSIVYNRLGFKQAYGSYRQPFYFSNSETLKVEKNSFTRVSDMNWLTNKKVTKILLWICLISCCSNRNLLY